MQADLSGMNLPENGHFIATSGNATEGNIKIHLRKLCCKQEMLAKEVEDKFNVYGSVYCKYIYIYIYICVCVCIYRNIFTIHGPINVKFILNFFCQHFLFTTQFPKMYLNIILRSISRCCNKMTIFWKVHSATLHSLFMSGNFSTCFGWYIHPSWGAHTTVSTASGICHSVTATYRYSGR